MTKNTMKAGIVSFVALACFFIVSSLYKTSSVVKAQTVKNVGGTFNSSLLGRAQASNLTVGELVDKLGSSNLGERREAAMTIFALRNHYVSGTEQVIVGGLLKKGDARVISSGFDTLAFLRPSAPAIIATADQNSTFTWIPRVVDVPVGGEAQPAQRILVRASLPALHLLQKYFENVADSTGSQLTPQQKLRLQVAIAILGPSAPLWFDNMAAKQTNPVLQRRILFYAHAVSASYAAGPDASLALSPQFNKVNLLGSFLNANALDEELDPSDLDQIDINKYVIDWDAPAKLSLATQEGTDRPVPPWSNERTVETVLASHDIERTVALLEYSICLRLNSDTNIKSRQSFVPYSSDAQVDAVRVLGSLRPTSLAPYVIWQRLRRTSMKIHIEDGSSLDTQVSLKALGQIDVPAVKMLVTRIASELSPEQQRAATYALGRVMGLYAVPYINQAMAVRRKAIIEETDQIYKEQYQDEIANLKNMLELGKEKKWFIGDYYGAHDPHAYDLIFDDTPAPTH